jgi:protein-disulfide isomerase
LLLGLQLFVIRRVCVICAGVDLSAIVAGALTLPLFKGAETYPRPAALARRLLRATAVLTAGVPLAIALSMPPRVPSWVAALRQPGKLDVIELSDFECPYCRAMHPVLTRALAPYRDRLHFVRRSYPLPGHPYARGAARAFACAQAQGKGDEMADFLFASEDLSLATAVRHAAVFGLDPARFASCVVDEGVDRALEAQMAAVRRAGFEGLPMVFIGDQALLGFDADQGAAPYARALARAASGDKGRSGAAAWTALALVTLLLALPLGRGRAPD